MTGQLFICDPVEDFEPRHDTTYVIMQEAEKRGRDIWTAASSDLFLRAGEELKVKARQFSVISDNPDTHCRELDRAEIPVESMELVWIREDPPFDDQYLYLTYLLEQLSETVVLNDPSGVRDSNEKLTILNFPDLTPDTWVGADMQKGLEFIDEHRGRAVAKSLSGFGGEEIYLIDREQKDPRQVLRNLTNEGTQTIMLQKFLSSVRKDGDRRLILLGGDPIGGLTRYPGEGDFRANLHAGGRPGETHISQREREICRQIKPELIRRGLHLVGLDLIEDRITEINVTSPTCVQEINRGEEVKLEEQIMDYAINLVK